MIIVLKLNNRAMKKVASHGRVCKVKGNYSLEVSYETSNDQGYVVITKRDWHKAKKTFAIPVSLAAPIGQRIIEASKRYVGPKEEIWFDNKKHDDD